MLSLKKSCLVLLASLLVANTLKGQSIVRGYVFEDSNKSRKKERSEKGLENVAVSNGREVVVTDKSGKYELPVGHDDIIFVIKPSGFNVPVNAYNQPQFYYLHKPSGSPELKYKGVAPTGKLPESVDFGLIPHTEQNDFSMLVFGDPQVTNLQEVDFFDRGIVDEVKNNHNSLIGMSLGDLAFNLLDVYDPYIKSISKIGIPWYNVIGNHDMNFDVKSDSLSDETFEAKFGPATYSFNYGNVHFIILDDVIYPALSGNGKYSGGLQDKQLKFIENDLKAVSKDKLVVLAMHIPIRTDNNMRGIKELFKLLEDYPNTLSLSAHTHNQWQAFFSKADGWMQQKPHHHYNVGTTSGNWYSGEFDEKGVPVTTMSDGTPKGYAFIGFSGNQYVLDYKVAGKPDDYRIGLWMPKVLERNKKGPGGVYANFFMGSQTDKLEYRIDGKKWQKMNLREDYDPAYLHSQLKWDTSDTLLSGTRRPGNPNPSRHLWWARLDNTLPVGEHIVEVRATDMFGRTFIQKGSYRIEER